MTIGTMTAARAIVRRKDVLGKVRVTLIVSNAEDESESHEMGTYYSRARAQSMADFAVDVLMRKVKQCGSFSSEDIWQAVLGAGGSVGGPRL
jgi:hypothetical protein